MKPTYKNVREAQGCILFHSVYLKNGRLRKGSVITSDDIRNLIQSNVRKIYVGKYKADEVDENQASALIAKALARNNFSVSASISGKSNISVRFDGLFEINENNLEELNKISPDIAISTLSNHDIVYAGDHVISVKIISFSIKKRHLHKVIDFIKNSKIISLRKFRSLKFGLLYTQSTNESLSLLNKAKKTITSRISDYNSSIMIEHKSRHDHASIKNSINQLLEMDLDCIMIFLSSSVSGQNDLLPSIIREMGGRITSYGMPVDPGNLTLSAMLKDKKILVAAGSARSEQLNGLDWHLNCIHANINVNQKMVNKLGVGGLLKDIDFIIKRKKISKSINTKKGNIAAVILAAGESTRMGAKNKLLMKVGKDSMIKDFVQKMKKSNVSDIIIVTGHEYKSIEDELKGIDVKFIYNPKFKEGMSTSLRAGIKSLEKRIDAAMICLPDMPLIGMYEINKLIEYYNPTIGNDICVATYNEARGNPVIWDKKYFKELMEVIGDKGGRDIIKLYKDKIAEVNLGEAVVFDVDTKESLSEANFIKAKNNI